MVFREALNPMAAAGCECPQVWGCLDDGAFLAAAERYLRAVEVHALLAQPRSPHAPHLRCFPLLAHHWPQVQTFGAQIAQRARAALVDDAAAGGGGGAAAAAAALGALAALEPQLPTAKLLALFLDARSTHVQTLLAAGGGDGRTPAEVLCAVVEVSERPAGPRNTSRVSKTRVSAPKAYRRTYKRHPRAGAYALLLPCRSPRSGEISTKVKGPLIAPRETCCKGGFTTPKHVHGG